MSKLAFMAWTTIGLFTLAGCRPGDGGNDAAKTGASGGAEKSAKVQLASGQANAVTVLPSGIKSAIVKEGSGAPPPPGSRIVAHVKGWISGRAPFLDTKARGKPFEGRLDKLSLISGLFESFSAMRKGEVRRVWVPSALGYGAAGYEGQVPPGADLDFDLELLSYEP
jgi:FKBP-type peptidyl-prolyl cis-trans isomerase